MAQVLVDHKKIPIKSEINHFFPVSLPKDTLKAKIVAFRHEQPNWDQNMWFTLQNERISVLSLCGQLLRGLGLRNVSKLLGILGNWSQTDSKNFRIFLISPASFRIHANSNLVTADSFLNTIKVVSIQTRNIISNWTGSPELKYHSWAPQTHSRDIVNILLITFSRSVLSVTDPRFFPFDLWPACFALGP